MLQHSDDLILLPYQVGPVLKTYNIVPLETPALAFPEFVSGAIYHRDIADNPHFQLFLQAAKKTVRAYSPPAEVLT